MVVKVFKKKKLTEDRRYLYVYMIEEADYDKTILLSRYDETFCPEEETIIVSPDEYIEVWMEDV